MTGDMKHTHDINKCETTIENTRICVEVSRVHLSLRAKRGSARL